MNTSQQFHLPRERSPSPKQGEASTYSCPMHPEVRSPRPGTCPKCNMVLEATPGSTGDSGHARASGKQRRFTLGACAFLAVAAFYLWTEHRAHLLGALPYLLLLLCPAMHLFMHHGHGDHESGSSHQH